MFRNKRINLFIFLIFTPVFIHSDNQSAYQEYQFAKKLFQEKLYSQAALQFQNFVISNPDHYQADSASFLIGYSYYLDKKFNESISFFHRFQLLYPNSELLAEVQYYLGINYYNLNETKKAIDILMEIHKKHPLSPYSEKAVYQAFQISYSSYRFEDAQSVGVAYTALFPQGEKKNLILLGLGEIHYKNGNINQALDRFNSICQQAEMNDTYYQALLYKAKILKQLGSLDNALSDLNLIIKKNNDFTPEALSISAEIQFRKGNRQASDEFYKELIQNFPDHYITISSYKKIIQKKQSKTIIEALNSSSKFHHSMILPTLFLAVSYSIENNWDSASYYLNQIPDKKLLPEHLEVYYTAKVKTLYYTGQYDLCESFLWELITKYKDAPEQSLWISQLINLFIDLNIHPMTIYSMTQQFHQENLTPLNLYKCGLYWYINHLDKYANEVFELFKKKYYYHPYIDSVKKIHKIYSFKNNPFYSIVAGSLFEKEFIPIAEEYFQGNDETFITQLFDYYEKNNSLKFQDYINDILMNSLEIAYIEKIFPDSILLDFGTKAQKRSNHPEKFQWFIEKNKLKTEEYNYKDITIQLEKSEHYLNLQKTQEALQMLLTILNQEPENKELSKCYFLLAKAYFQKKDYQVSLNYLTQYKKNPSCQDYQIYGAYYEFLCHYNMNNKETAVNQGLNFIRKYPMFIQTCQIIDKLFEYQIDSLNLEINSGLIHPEEYLFLGQISLLNNDYPSALDFFNQVPESSPDYALSLYYKGIAYQKSGKYRQASESFKEYISIPNGDKKISAIFNLAEIYFKEDLSSLVSILLQDIKDDTSLSKDEISKKNYYLLKYEIINGKDTKIKDAIKNLKGQFPEERKNYYQLMNSLAEKYIDNKELAYAEKIISEIQKDKDIPQKEKLRTDKTSAVLLINEKKYDEAITLLNNSIPLTDDEELLSEMYFTLSTANYYKEPQNITASIEAYEKLLKLNTPNKKLLGETYFNLGMLYEEVKEFSKAIDQYRSLINEFPNHDRKDNAVFRIGFCYYSTFKYTEAILTYRAHIPFAKGKDAAELHFYLGDCYRKSGADNKAIVEFLKVAYDYNMYPMFAVTALYMVGEIYQLKGDMDKALIIYEKIVKTYGSSSQYGEMAAQRLKELKE